MLALLWMQRRTMMSRLWGRPTARAVLSGNRRLKSVSKCLSLPRTAGIPHLAKNERDVGHPGFVRIPRLRLPARDNFNFKNRRPLLAGDEQAVSLRVVSDPVQHRFRIDLLIVGQQTGEIDPCNHVSVTG